MLEIARAPSLETMLELVEAIVVERLDRAAIRELRQAMMQPDDNGAADDHGEGGDEVEVKRPRRPYVWKLQVRRQAVQGFFGV